jgi:hypothetical protein
MDLEYLGGLMDLLGRWGLLGHLKDLFLLEDQLDLLDLWGRRKDRWDLLGQLCYYLVGQWDQLDRWDLWLRLNQFLLVDLLDLWDLRL